MNPKLESLIKKFKEERELRDGGAAARKTYVKIKALASAKELIALLEELAHLKRD